ncbi:MAG: bifunctional demethylmenaquinone methyltransferase/2-methoxy-6-polyprenyl-1,4-benzoquinol methylase UbiE [Pseudanabaenaceae cyanobacterium bins.68]|nr:bifunctional demethylmenaquinone methyltransferase/2-methoxy-6-polyprenyl-1,4-benzoquinol methylase UbiE [Pseudanabaenaceae cyanobacterium bins.68]
MAEIQQLFNRIAPNYDRLNQWLSLGQHRLWKKLAVRWCDPQPGDLFLDLCCGTGDLALLLAPYLHPSGQVIGVDFADQLLAIAATKAQLLPAKYQALISWHQGDVLNLNLPSHRFDGAVISYGLRNVVDIPGCLAELHRLLKPGAIATILDFHRPSPGAIADFQAWYLANLVVPLADQLGLKSDYAYIFPSLEKFPNGKGQEQLAIAAGFAQAEHFQLAGGMMGILKLQA